MQRRQHLPLEQLPQLQKRNKSARLQVHAMLAAPSLGKVLELIVDSLQTVVERSVRHPLSPAAPDG